MSDRNIYTHNTYGIDSGKAQELDLDRSIPLTHEVADLFARQANQALARVQARELLTNGRAELLAQCITNNRYFPFVAHVEEDAIILSPSLDKRDSAAVLKDVSDGFTEVFKDMVRREEASEGFKFALTQLLQPALYETYCAAGMPEGPHTKYTLRSC